MPIKIKASTSELKRLAKDADRTGSSMVNEILEAVNHAAITGWRESREAAPVFMGLLANSIQAMPATIIRATSNRTTIQADFHTGALAWAEPMEYGRTSHVPPPFDAILRWVELKASRGQFKIHQRPGQTRQQAIESAAFAVRQSIAVHGTEPRGFMLQGEQAALKTLDPLVERGVEVATERLARNVK